jgi:peptidoglycan/LPS O-acetylase OafA/YrhL
MFFALSGFVIAGRYEALLDEPGGLKRFLWARARRLGPTMLLGYLFSVGCLLPVYLKGMGLWRDVPAIAFAGAAVSGALLLPLSLMPIRMYPAFAGEDYPLDPPLWSLFSEAIANALYGIVLYAVRLRVLIMTALVLWGGLFALSFHSSLAWGALLPGAGRGVSGFIAGVVLWRLYKTERLSFLPSINPLIIFSIWFLVCCVPYRPSISLFGSIVGAAGVPFSIALLIRTQRSTPPFFIWLGFISYPLYVSHFGFVWITVSFLGLDAKRHSVLWAVPMIAGALLVAWTIAKATEKARGVRPLLANSTGLAVMVPDEQGLTG